VSPDLFQVLLSPWFLGVVGLCVGSFLNVVAHRLPIVMERQWWGDVAHQLTDTDSLRRTFAAAKGSPVPEEADAAALGAALQTRLGALSPLGLARPASRCPSCGTAIAWWHNLPVLGFLLVRGRCASCRAPIGWRYPAVEAVVGLLFAAVAWRFGAQPLALLWCGFAAALVALSLIDWDTTLLPDSITMPLLWAGLLAAWLGWTVPVGDALLGATAGYLSLWAVYWLFKLTTGKEGMGQGDFKLLAALGAWLGWSMVLPIVLMASVLGAVVGLGMKATGALREGRFVPFGPFLAIGGLVVMFAGAPRMLGWLGWA
jgi:leader peptidase (prepilin peptidase) / N-methyltransferase